MNRLIKTLLILLVLSSCKDTSMYINSDTQIIGHGGMGITHDYPLNSFEGIAFALHKGADGVEIDVQMTKDSVLVAYHDESLEEMMKGEGRIHEVLWKDLRNEEYRELLYGEYGVVSIDDIFSHLPKFREKTYFFDIKDFTGDTTGAVIQAIIRKLNVITENYNLVNTIYEIKSIPPALYAKGLNPDQKVYLYMDYDLALDSCLYYGLDGITQDIDKYVIDDVLIAHKNGVKLACLNTHSTERNDRAHELGIDFNQTDMVNYVLRKTR